MQKKLIINYLYDEFKLVDSKKKESRFLNMKRSPISGPLFC